jgi:hypothetical protein
MVILCECKNATETASCAASVIFIRLFYMLNKLDLFPVLEWSGIQPQQIGWHLTIEKRDW